MFRTSFNSKAVLFLSIVLSFSILRDTRPSARGNRYRGTFSESAAKVETFVPCILCVNGARSRGEGEKVSRTKPTRRKTRRPTQLVFLLSSSRVHHSSARCVISYPRGRPLGNFRYNVGFVDNLRRLLPEFFQLDYIYIYPAGR